MTPARTTAPRRPDAGPERPPAAPTPVRRSSAPRSELTAAGLLGLQRHAGNRAVTSLVRSMQRVGGWSDADKRPGSGLAPGEAKTGWNTEEHAVGSIRRIPIDGLVSGLQDSPSEDGAKKFGLTRENVAGKITGPARSDPDEQDGRGRAIALIPSRLDPESQVDVLFHLHGNTERADRGFGGWRQHKDTGKVRDVERDRIAQQIESAGSHQLAAILPMGHNKSDFGKISPDSYIRDAFDRLAELGTWKDKPAPTDFRVVLSAHSGGGVAVERMMKGRTGYQLPQKLGMIVLFEANNNEKDIKKGKRAFEAWAVRQLDAHHAYLTGGHTHDEKTRYLADATRLRAYFDPRDASYARTYGDLRTVINNWFTDARKTALGKYLPAVTQLMQVIEQEVVGKHEGLMRAHLGGALAARPGAVAPPSGGGGAPAPGPAAPGATPPAPAPARPTGGAATGSAAMSEREAAITPAMVAAQAGAGGAGASAAFTVATGAGMPRLRAAATALAAAGIRSDINLTDALFALVRSELGGARIAADREDLKREWRQLRRTYAQPALAPSGAQETPVADTAPTPTSTPATTTSTPTAPPKSGGAHLTPEEEYASFNGSVKAKFRGGLKQYLAVRELYRTRPETAGNPAEWLNQLQFGVAFCGTKLSGVHPRLLSALQGVDEECTKLAAAVRASGAPVVFQGDFQPRAVTNKPTKLSDHALGLALHLNYKNNPFIGRNEAASQLVARIAAQAGQDKFWDSVKGSGRNTTQARIEQIYRAWAATSDAVARYFVEMDALKIKAASTALDAATRQEAAAELAKRTKEYWQLRNSDLAKHRDPKNGVFMHTAGVEGDPMLQIIKQLTGAAGLEWGGTYTTRPKDLHHFAFKL